MPGCPDGDRPDAGEFQHQHLRAASWQIVSKFGRSCITTGKQAGQVVSYEDLWKFTLLNYTSGSGCLGNAIQRTINNGNVLNWENIAYNLQPACRTGIDYVDEVSSMPEEEGLGVEDYLVSPTSASPIAPMPTLPNVIYPTPRPGETWPYP